MAYTELITACCLARTNHQPARARSVALCYVYLCVCVCVCKGGYLGNLRVSVK